LTAAKRVHQNVDFAPTTMLHSDDEYSDDESEDE
jgi:hypothetical protein